MILNDVAIAELIETSILNSEPAHINPASLDICIGDNIILMTPDGNYAKDLHIYTKGSPFLIYPNERLLANSLEYFNFPNDIAGEFKLKSSVARQFFQHMKAGWIDPGWNGTLTMEFINWGHHAFPIYKGKRIGQIIFHKLDPAPLMPYQGKYNGQLKAQPYL